MQYKAYNTDLIGGVCREAQEKAAKLFAGFVFPFLFSRPCLFFHIPVLHFVYLGTYSVSFQFVAEV
jgi:hypothetical protein